MVSLRDLLILFRAQTAAATVFTITIPYILAGGDIALLAVLVPLGILTHFFSFGHNSVMDYWYDIHDPNKAHHPLESGRIELHTAHQIIHTGQVILAVALCVLALFKSPAALTPLLLYIVFGHAYNDGLDKNTILSFLPISLCFTSLAAYGWVLANGEVNSIFALVLLWAFLTILYQIGWEGNLKDVWNPSERRFNLIVKIGRKEQTIIIPLWFSITMISLRVIANSVIILLIYMLMDPHNLVFPAIFMLFTFLSLRPVLKLHINPKMDRKLLLEHFGQAEAFEFFRFMNLLILTPNAYLFLLLTVFGILWFIGMNRYLFGTTFGPKV